MVIYYDNDKLWSDKTDTNRAYTWQMYEVLDSKRLSAKGMEAADDMQRTMHGGDQDHS